VTTINCPSCGTEIPVDVLTGEPRPCKKCGAVATVDESGRLIPDADHQNNINRQKFFEIAAVIVMILVGFGYFAISNDGTGSGVAGSTSSADLGAILRAEEFKELGQASALNQTFDQFRAQAGILQTSVDVVSVNDNSQADAILIAVGLPSGKTMPPDAVAEKAIQEAFDQVTELAELLLPASTESLSKAVNTTVPVTHGDIVIRKGVAQTNSGWKITYINYRAMAQNEVETPLLLFIYQRLDAASDPAQKEFNQVLFTAANEGWNVIAAMQRHEGGEDLGE
jgi:hypothetical protein